MISRLEQALRQLPPAKIEQVADFAETLAQQSAAQGFALQHLKLDWRGKAADAYPDASGVDAAHTVAEMIRGSLDRATKG